MFLAEGRFVGMATSETVGLGADVGGGAQWRRVLGRMRGEAAGGRRVKPWQLERRRNTDIRLWRNFNIIDLAVDLFLLRVNVFST